MNIYFAHGKESGPWGVKFEALAQVARLKGFIVESPDHRKQPDPDARVEQLLSMQLPASDLTVLVGSSMGGYVATIASHIINPVGLFLMAPAFYLPGYKEQNPIPHAKITVIVHGLKDDVVPVENSVRFAREHNTELYLVDSDHRLNSQLPKIETLFDMFLDEVLELSSLQKVLTCEDIDKRIWFCDDWMMQVWGKIIENGHATYRSKEDLKQVGLIFMALYDFYQEVLSEFSREPFKLDPEKIATAFELLFGIRECQLKASGPKRNDSDKISVESHDSLQNVIQTYVYPAALEIFGGVDGVAKSIYSLSYPTIYDEEGDNDYVIDPEDESISVNDYIIVPEEDEEPRDTEIVRIEALKKISLWLEGKFTAKMEEASK